jgi:SAM-dependent methyltransferase
MKATDSRIEATPPQEHTSLGPGIPSIHHPLEAGPRRHDLACIDITNMRGLEIGPLAAPRIRKSEGNVRYVDHADAEELRHKYAADPDMKDRLHEIVEVDYVVGKDQEVLDVVSHDAPFDYVVASHLIEHIPDPVGWLADMAHILRAGGILSLIIPDKRYCFDINRRTSDISQVVDAHLRKLRQPSFSQVYDFISKEISGKVDTAAVWAGTADYSGIVRSDVEDPDVAALSMCRSMENTSDFIDVHCTVFTPDSFLELYETLVRLSLIEFEIAHFVPTETNTLEFHASLRRLDPSLDRQSMIRRQHASVVAVRPTAAAVAPQSEVVAAAPISMNVSEFEQRLLTGKRWLSRHIRAAVGRIEP